MSVEKNAVLDGDDDKLVLDPADMPLKDGAEDTKTEKVDDDDLGEYSEKVKKRINKEVWKRAEAQRERDALAERLKEYERRLADVETRATKSQDEALTATETALKNEQLRLRRELRDAQEVGDADKIFDATEKIADVRYEMKRLEDNKAKRPKVEDKPAVQQQAQPQTRSNDKAVNWAAENGDWFGKDRVMTGAAYAIDAQLKDEGYDPTSDDYYAEVTKRVREAFPHKFKREVAQSAVAGVNRGASNGARKVTKLTDSEKDVARRLGVPEEAYAKYKGVA